MNDHANLHIWLIGIQMFYIRFHLLTSRNIFAKYHDFIKKK